MLVPRSCGRVVFDFRWSIAGLFVLHQRMVVLLLLGLWSAAPWAAAQAAVIMVNTVTDTDDVDDRCPDTCSLRAALASAQPGDTIQFRVNGTIVLTEGPLVVDKDATITGPGANLLALDGDEASRVLEVRPGVTATISGITIQHGVSDNNSDGGIDNVGTLTVTHSTFSGNRASQGGGLLNVGTVTVTHSTFSGNSATNFGGGLYNSSAELTVINSTLSGNGASQGGGLFNFGTVSLARSIVAHSSSGGYCDGTPITSQGDNISDDGTCVATTPALNDRSETDPRLDPTG